MKRVTKIIILKIKLLGMSLPLLLLFSCRAEHVHKPENTKPNIVLFVADDLGWNDVGYHGSEIKTPNIDKLAKNGVELNQFYVYPTSSPSRASLLTGKYASRFGIGGPIALNSKQVLPLNVETIPLILKKSGYETAIMGKWHLGLSLKNGPNHYGFDYTYGYLHGQIDQYTHLYKNGEITWNRNGKFINEEGHATDLITKEAIKYLKEIHKKENPFFLYIPYSVPHYPLQEEAKWIEPYQNLNDVESRKIFAASVAHMDFSLGEILRYLENEKLLENTLIIFISDNGAERDWYPNKEKGLNLYNGKHGPYPKLGDNSPLKGFKTELSEGGIKVPAIIYWKDHLMKNKLEQLIKVTDIFPTILSAAQIDGSNLKNLDGESVWKSVIDPAKITFERELYLRTDKHSMLRMGDWKIIQLNNSDNTKYELYNILQDPFEKENLIDKYPQIRDELIAKLKILNTQ